MHKIHLKLKYVSPVGKLLLFIYIQTHTALIHYLVPKIVSNSHYIQETGLKFWVSSSGFPETVNWAWMENEESMEFKDN